MQTFLPINKFGKRTDRCLRSPLSRLRRQSGGEKKMRFRCCDTDGSHSCLSVSVFLWPIVIKFIYAIQNGSAAIQIALVPSPRLCVAPNSSGATASSVRIASRAEPVNHAGITCSQSHARPKVAKYFCRSGGLFSFLRDCVEQTAERDRRKVEN